MAAAAPWLNPATTTRERGTPPRDAAAAMTASMRSAAAARSAAAPAATSAVGTVPTEMAPMGNQLRSLPARSVPADGPMMEV